MTMPMAAAAARRGVLVASLLLLATSVSAQLLSSVPVTPLLQLQAGRVIPDVLSRLSASPKNITITYPAGTVNYGNEMLVNQTQAAPTVDVTNADGGSLYTLILSNPDVPDPAVAGPTSGYLHWLVVNIQGAALTNITSTGLPLAPYQPPAPPIGLHRYVFQLYKQNATGPIANTTVTRSGFLPKTFAASNSLEPVAARYFLAQPGGANNSTTTANGSTVEVQALQRGRVIPQVVPIFTPLARLNVSYGYGSLAYGQILQPAEATSPLAVFVQGLAPGIIYNSTFPYFTLVIVDPDAPDPTTPTSSLILHYLKVNIPTNTPASNIFNVTGGNVLQQYAPPNPPTGLHRYTFVLYGQGRLSNATAPATRSQFNLASFALNNTLGSPLAAFYFNAIKVNTTAAAINAPPAPVDNVPSVIPAVTTAPVTTPPAPAPIVTTEVPTPAPTLAPTNPPEEPPLSPKGSSFPVGPVVGGSLAGAAVLIGLTGLVMFCLRWWQQRMRMSEIEAGLEGGRKEVIEEKSIPRTPVISKSRQEHYTFKQLQKATGNFSDASLLGRGSFGLVYKGVFPDGSVVAVKRLETRPGRKQIEEKSWKAEVEAFCNVCHKNLVPLLGVCVERGERLLVFEFFAGGTLDRRLHHAEAGETVLSWADRMSISRSICRGLTYLHNDIRPPMVHRDIKGANILLTSDDHPEACIADFGLAHLVQDVGNKTSTMVKGTVPYMAPEYLHGGGRFLSPKCDVYSFGMLLLELISGRPVVRQLETGVVEPLLKVSMDAIREERVLELVDPKLGTDFDEEEARKCINVAMTCLRADPSIRPTMEVVGSRLVVSPTADPGFREEDMWGSEGPSLFVGSLSSSSIGPSNAQSTVLVASRFVTPR